MWGIPVGSIPENSITTTTSLFVDGNRTDSYTPTGSIAFPYKTITAALAAVNAATQIIIAPGTYVEDATAFPAFPLVFFANNSDVTFSNNLTIVASFRSYDANIIGNITYAGANTDRYFLSGGSRAGNIILTNGMLHVEGSSLLAGTVTINGGTLEIIATTCTSQFVHTAGNFLMQQTNVNATESTAMITSTATDAASSFQIVNSIVANLGTGTALDISANTQATAHANGLANTNFITASAASVIGGTAVVEVADCNYTILPTGTGFTGTNWGYLGARTLTGSITIPSNAVYDLGSSTTNRLRSAFMQQLWTQNIQGGGNTGVSSLYSDNMLGSVIVGTALTSGSLALGGITQTGPTIIRGGATTITAATTISASTNDLNYISGTAYAITLPTTLISAKEKTFCNNIAYTIVIPSGVTVYGNGTSYTNVTKTVAINQVVKLIQISATVWFITPCTLS